MKKIHSFEKYLWYDIRKQRNWLKHMNCGGEKLPWTEWDTALVLIFYWRRRSHEPQRCMASGKCSFALGPETRNDFSTHLVNICHTIIEQVIEGRTWKIHAVPNKKDVIYTLQIRYKLRFRRTEKIIHGYIVKKGRIKHQIWFFNISSFSI